MKSVFENIGNINGKVGLPGDEHMIDMWIQEMTEE